ncbi:hypothetical protein NDU88_007861 [Pleurodeles waltl]|uniref:Uncharacterized protein n=1 Tax=Pleurodeles waltl TaxID=8319 RepID=A0AAV7STI7_PLEWA|nr:hypothetical protein NDU88_007861 [Pleurodeles waltl]
MQESSEASSSHVKERSQSPSNPFQFNPEDIIHPRSADWAPAQAVADYLHDKLRKGFDEIGAKSRIAGSCCTVHLARTFLLDECLSSISCFFPGRSFKFLVMSA